MWIHLLTLGLIDGAGDGVQPPVVVTPTVQPGVRHSRFLRRSKRLELPWEEVEETTNDGVIVKSKRIRLPRVQEIERVVSPIPVEKFKDLPAVEITISDLGTARLEKYDEDEEDDLLWMM